jgi:hypothetical protein
LGCRRRERRRRPRTGCRSRTFLGFMAGRGQSVVSHGQACPPPREQNVGWAGAISASKAPWGAAELLPAHEPHLTAGQLAKCGDAGGLGKGENSCEVGAVCAAALGPARAAIARRMHKKRRRESAMHARARRLRALPCSRTSIPHLRAHEGSESVHVHAGSKVHTTAYPPLRAALCGAHPLSMVPHVMLAGHCVSATHGGGAHWPAGEHCCPPVQLPHGAAPPQPSGVGGRAVVCGLQAYTTQGTGARAPRAKHVGRAGRCAPGTTPHTRPAHAAALGSHGGGITASHCPAALHVSFAAQTPAHARGGGGVMRGAGVSSRLAGRGACLLASNGASVR